MTLLACACAAFAGPGDAPPCSPYMYRVHWTGEYDGLYYAEAVQVAGDLAYVADRALGLRIIDVSDPTLPVRAGGAEFGFGALDLAVDEPLVYLALGTNGLRVLDATDPMAPTFVDSLGLPGRAGHMDKQGDLIYVSCGPGGLQIVDASDPADLVLLGGISLGVNMQDVAVADTVAFVGYAEGGVNTVRAFDVSDPAAPVPLGAVTTPNAPTGMALAGDLLYVACGNLAGTEDGCLQVVDVTVPSAPVAGAVLVQPPGARNVLVDGGALWSCGALTGDANFGYLHAFDLTDPALPVFSSETVLRHWSEGVDLVNGHLCLAAGYDPGNELFRRGSLQVVAKPSLEVVVPPTRLELAYVNGLALDNDLAYLSAGFDGLRIVDVLDPYAPVEIGTADTPGESYDVAVAGGFAYLADGSNGLQVVDVTDPALPVVRGAAGMTGARALDLSDTLACVASIHDDGTTGYLEVVDVSDPDNPVPGGGLATDHAITDLVIDGAYVFITMDHSTLKVVELDYPAPPVVVAEMALPGRGNALALDGTTLYVAAYPDVDQGGLWVVDVTDALAPALLADVAAPATAMDVAVAGSLLYLGCGTAGTAVYDVAFPSAPVLVGVLGGPSGALAATDDGVHLTLADHGLQIAGLPCGPVSSVAPEAAPFAAAAPRAHPNPFNPQATITFVMARTERVEVAVYDLAGRRIAVLADGVLDAGEQTVQWNGRDLSGRNASSGIYLLRMTTADRVLGGKATLLR